MSEQQQINSNNILGNSTQDLILETFGKVSIKVKDKYYNLDFKNNTLNKTSDDIKSSDVIVVSNSNDILGLSYPGDNKIILTLDGFIFFTKNNEIKPFKSNNTNINNNIFDDIILNGQLKSNVTSIPPFIVKSSILNKNLNVEYLNGFNQEKFTLKHLNETVLGKWIFKDNIYIEKSLLSNQNRSTVYPTVLNFNESSLDIDYINVRKSLRVYEYIINKIKATNGSLWISDSGTIDYIMSENYESEILYDFDPYLEIEKDFNFKKLDNTWHSLIEWYRIYISNYTIYDDITKKYIDVDPSPSPKDISIVDLNNTEQVKKAEFFLYENYEKSKALGYIYYDENKIEHRYSLSHFADTIYNCLISKKNINILYPGKAITFKIKSEGKTDTCPFWLNDIVKCQKIENLIDVYNYEGIVTYAYNNVVRIKFKEIAPKLEIGDILTRIDNIIHPDRRGAIYLTSSDYKAPYIDIIDNTGYDYINKYLRIDTKFDKNTGETISIPPEYIKINEENNLNYKSNGNIKLRLGRLDGLAPDDIFGNFKGMGMFLQGSVDKNYIPITTDMIHPTDKRKYTHIEVIEHRAKYYNSGIYLKNATIQLGDPNNTENKVGILLNPDGSGFLAQKSIYWTSDGSLFIEGNDKGLSIINGNINLGYISDKNYNKDGDKTNSNNYITHLNNNGSGWFAKKNLSWETNGNLNLTNCNINLSNNIKLNSDGTGFIGKESFSWHLDIIDPVTMETWKDWVFDFKNELDKISINVLNWNNPNVLLGYATCNMTFNYKSYISGNISGYKTGMVFKNTRHFISSIGGIEIKEILPPTIQFGDKNIINNTVVYSGMPGRIENVDTLLLAKVDKYGKPKLGSIIFGDGTIQTTASYNFLCCGTICKREWDGELSVNNLTIRNKGIITPYITITNLSISIRFASYNDYNSVSFINIHNNELLPIDKIVTRGVEEDKWNITYKINKIVELSYILYSL